MVFYCENSIDLNKIDLLNSSEPRLFIGNYVYNRSFLENGLIFSQPLFISGLKIVKNSENRAIWSFFTPLNYEIVIIILIIGVLTGVFIWIFEENKWKKPIKEHFDAIQEIIKEVFGSFFTGNSLFFRRWTSKMLLWSFWLIFLLFLIAFQIQLFINMMNSFDFYEGFFDFKEKKYGILVPFDKLMGKNGENIRNLYVYNSSELLFEDFFIKKSLDFVFLDTFAQNWFENKGNQMKILDDFVIEYAYVAVFIGNSTDFLEEFSKSLIKYQNTIDYLEKTKRFQHNNTIKSENLFINYEITNEKLIGMWILLLTAIILLLFMLITRKLALIPMNFLRNKGSLVNRMRNLSNEHIKEIENEFQESFSSGISSKFMMVYLKIKGF